MIWFRKISAASNGKLIRAYLSDSTALDEPGRDLRQEPGLPVVTRATEPGARRCPGHIKPLHRSGDADVGQSPFLGQLPLVAH